MEEIEECEEVDTEIHCAICMEEYKHKTCVFYLNMRKVVKVCNHEFCQECIVNWVRTNHSKTCPLCRRSLLYETQITNSDTDSDTDSENEFTEDSVVSPDDIYITP